VERAPSRNVEIKARARHPERQAQLAEALADGPAERLVQEDTFFVVPAGRLKLRVFGGGQGELIQYERSDSRAPSESRYVVAPTAEPEALRAALSRALGVRAVVRKTRTVHLAGRTRIHLDRVEGLGDFIELEVVLRPEEEAAVGVSVARELMARLEIAEDDLVEAAYVDLLEGRES
jgi:predicted adenylyl cyclase CyaB